jgi:DNA-binding NtrC family response regulator
VIGVLDLGGHGLVRAALEPGALALLDLLSAANARRCLAARAVRTLVLEVDALDPEARELLAAARAACVPALVVARDRSAATAVLALRSGAADYLAAPFEYGSLLAAVERLGDGAAALEPPPEVGERFLTADPEASALLELARSVAASDATVLVLGESGTGKELVARLVHRASPRRARELVSVNCAALPAGLLESELFGHERGAFTGAFARALGKFELAHGGTILLDEIGELEPGLQAKLLRVLQEKQVQRVGAPRPVSVDFRLIATTNRELEAEVRAGRFREDLYYRLNVLPLRIPPLRARRGDVLLLAQHFLREHARRGRPVPELAPQTLEALAAHAWPGNVRELANLIERLVLTHPGRVVSPAELGLAHAATPTGAVLTPAPARAPESAPPRTLHEMERRMIVEALARLEGNRTRAARELGISLRTLRNKIHEHAIVEPETQARSGLPRAPHPRPRALERELP